jgi:preprotein translocase subunit SecF
MPVFKTPNFDFLKWRWYASALSLLIIIAGFVMIGTSGLPLGIDFSGGTLVVLRFEEPITEEAVRDALSDIDNKVIQRFGVATDNEIMIRLPIAGPEDGTSLEEGAEAIVTALEGRSIGSFTVESRELVGPVIGEELTQRGINAFFFALAGILVYIGLRFRFSFAVGAVVAVAHDILITVAMLIFFGYELSLNVVAAMLTITGYSVNDSIVVFDRVRENLRSMRRDQFEHLVNTSINQTLARTIITSGTTVFAVGALYIFGGEVLRGFAFTMIIGVISGTYSTIFIAASIAVVITQSRAARQARFATTAPTAVQKSQKSPNAQTSSGPRTRPRSKRPGRKARAS